jgi:hypothetical protein
MFAVMGVLDFHMGIDAYTGPLKPQKGFMDPEKFAAAFARGLNMTVDIQTECDPAGCSCQKKALKFGPLW